MTERHKLATPEELAQMTTEEKANRYALDVLSTEGSNYTYDFLFGGGSLGHPARPTIIGQAVCEVAREVDSPTVNFLDFTLAQFDRPITVEAVEKVFLPIWKSLDNPNTEYK